jgi:hypothetical protein
VERIGMMIPWIELARESAQLAVRLARAWGVGAHDRAATVIESWKIISADAGEEARGPTARKVRKIVKARQKSSHVARTATKRAAATHQKSKMVRRTPRR